MSQAFGTSCSSLTITTEKRLTDAEFTAPRRLHLPALDGIRGLAALLVFGFHYGGGAHSSLFVLRTMGRVCQAGWSGVSLFFVLSGFLISGIIWDSKKQLDWWKRFYIRRTLRIFPLYYASLAVVCLAGFAFGQARFSLSHIYIYALYLQNLPLHTSATLGSPLLLSHFWSLAVEEQFYLFWPFLLTRMHTLTQAKRLCLVVFIVSALFRIIAFYLIPAPPSTPGITAHQLFHGAYGFTLSRAGELAAGTYLAMCYREPTIWSRLKVLAPYLCAVGVGGFFIAARVAKGLALESGPVFLVGIPSLTVGFSGLLILAMGTGMVSQVACLSFLRWMGGISYGFYIFHVLFTPIFEWLAAAIDPHASHNIGIGITFVVAGCLSSFLAWLSFRWFESPFLRRQAAYRYYANPSRQPDQVQA